MTSDVLLVRHTEVRLSWKHRCYGRSDVALSRTGRRHALELAARLAQEPITTIIHSGLARAALLAGLLAKLKHVEPIIESRWRERDFGEWEGRTWNAIWRETGNAMDGMLSSPRHFRPGGGETTSELAERSIAAWRALPRAGLVVVITHGGPIAAVRAMRAGAPLGDMALYRVAEGEVVRIPGSAITE
jgi:broad specificity phosphatase PhoE